MTKKEKKPDFIRIYETKEVYGDHVDEQINNHLKTVSQYCAFHLIDLKYFRDGYNHSHALIIYYYVVDLK